MLDPLTLDQLRVLVAVADGGSFSAAARSLMRVQSAVSQSVQALEATLNVSLFDRSAKLPRLTEAGRAVLTDARRLLAEVALLRARTDSISRGLEPELSLALTPVLPVDVVIGALRDLSREFPQLPVTLLTEPLGAPERHLRAGTVQIAMYFLEEDHGELDGEFLTDVAFVPVVASDHPLARIEGPLTRAELQQHVQLVLTDTADPQDWSFGVVSTRVWRTADMCSRRDLLLAGFGWCNMPLHTVETHIAEGRLKRLATRERAGYELPVHAVYKRGRPPGVAGRWLIDRLRRGLREAGCGAIPAEAGPDGAPAREAQPGDEGCSAAAGVG